MTDSFCQYSNCAIKEIHTHCFKEGCKWATDCKYSDYEGGWRSDNTHFHCDRSECDFDTDECHAHCTICDEAVVYEKYAGVERRTYHKHCNICDKTKKHDHCVMCNTRLMPEDKPVFADPPRDRCGICRKDCDYLRCDECNVYFSIYHNITYHRGLEKVCAESVCISCDDRYFDADRTLRYIGTQEY